MWPQRHSSYVIHVVERSSWPSSHCQYPQNYLGDAGVVEVLSSIVYLHRQTTQLY